MEEEEEEEMGSLSSSSLAENLVFFLDGCLRERGNERLVVRANWCLGWKEMKAGLVLRGDEGGERKREVMAREEEVVKTEKNAWRVLGVDLEIRTGAEGESRKV